MILADKILIALYNANKYSNTLLTQINTDITFGQDVCELENKYIILGQWIRILQNYYDNNFDEEGTSITPAFTCLSQDQIIELMSKLKLAQGNNKYPITSIFQLGIWFEAGGFYWNDLETWFDKPELA